MFVCAFFGEASEAKKPSSPKRSVFYPRPVARIVFDHAKHQAVACNTCHAKIGWADRQASYVPPETVCRSCHAQQTRAPGPNLETKRKSVLEQEPRCGFCHGQSRQRTPAKVLRPTSRLRFSHRVHELKGVACRNCHGSSKALQMPKMATCMSCHARRKVSNRCNTCHLTGKDGRMVVKFGKDMVKPSGNLRGDRHTRIFARAHGPIASRDRRYCETCHTQQSCLGCHSGSFKPWRIHGSDYITHHVMDARRNQPRCTGCHRHQSFCLSCHERTGVSQQSRRGGFRPSTGRSFHPPGFASPVVGPKHHKFAARSNLAGCASCHAERTCTGCHGSRTRSRGGISPHGPGFSRSPKCRALASRNQRVCMKCHSSTDAALRCR